MIPHSRPCLEPADQAAVLAQLASGMLAEGAGTARLETALARRFGFVAAVAVGSGCQALLLALRLYGVVPGRRVVLPTYLCPEVLGVVEALGAQPVLADVTPAGMLDPADPALAEPCDAVVLPWLFGAAAALGEYPVPQERLLPDWAQYAPLHAAGAHQAARCAVLSFEATKLLAGAEGGAVLLRDPADAARVAGFKRLDGAAYKLNLYPFSDLQAALLLAQLPRLDGFLARRRAIAAEYDAAFATLARARPLPRQADAAPFRYLLALDAPGGLDAAMARLAERGVAARRPVAVMLHQVRPQRREFPQAERLFDRVLSVPLYPALAEVEVARVVAAVREVLG